MFSSVAHAGRVAPCLRARPALLKTLVEPHSAHATLEATPTATTKLPAPCNALARIESQTSDLSHRYEVNWDEAGFLSWGWQVRAGAHSHKHKARVHVRPPHTRRMWPSGTEGPWRTLAPTQSCPLAAGLRPCNLHPCSGRAPRQAALSPPAPRACHQTIPPCAPNPATLEAGCDFAMLPCEQYAQRYPDNPYFCSAAEAASNAPACTHDGVSLTICKNVTSFNGCFVKARPRREAAAGAATGKSVARLLAPVAPQGCLLPSSPSARPPASPSLVSTSPPIRASPHSPGAHRQVAKLPQPQGPGHARRRGRRRLGARRNQPLHPDDGPHEVPDKGRARDVCRVQAGLSG